MGGLAFHVECGPKHSSEPLRGSVLDIFLGSVIPVREMTVLSRVTERKGVSDLLASLP
jgi:hypothetical protein